MQQNNGRGRVVVRKRTPSASVSGTSLASLDQTAIYSDYLQHFGIPGMKWGIRRYQNEDGSYTEEGKQRYGRDNTPESETWKKSDAENLSDEELNRRNSRLQREKQYKDLTTSEVERERNQFKKDLIKKAAIVPLVAAVGMVANYYSKKAGVKIPDLINRFSRIGLSKIKSGLSAMKARTGMLNRYSAPTGPANAARQPFYQKYQGLNGSENLVRNLKNKYRPRTFNYRPRNNNAMPKSRSWPNNWWNVETKK